MKVVFKSAWKVLEYESREAAEQEPAPLPTTGDSAALSTQVFFTDSVSVEDENNCWRARM